MHKSVMINDIIEECQESLGILDCTFGCGGHSEAILSHNISSTILAIDRDENTKQFFKPLELKFSQRITYVNDVFSNFEHYISNLKNFNTVILDLGVSQFQIKYQDGFSFKCDTYLDMTMGNQCKHNAHHIINFYSYKSLVNIFKNNGANINVENVVKSIIKSRPITTTFELRDVISTCFSFPSGRIYARYFQALRIEVNNELQELKNFLKKIKKYKVKIYIITFHSIEENIINSFFKKNNIIFEKRKSSQIEKDNNSNSNSATLFIGIIN